MALTRKMLTAMEIPAEKIEEIISAHAETVNALKEERDSLKADVEKLSDAERELKAANRELDALRDGDWENKYKELKSEYDSYKTDTETKATKAAKEAAYKKLLQDAGVSEKRIASILKVTDVDGISIDKDGNVKDADKLTESIKSEWADFIVTKQEQGANIPKPPANDGEVKQPSRAAEMVAKYRNEHYGNPVKEE